ncbi:MAG: hypothetical protein AAGC85_01755 [Bacteroidota bacterium]
MHVPFEAPEFSNRLWVNCACISGEERKKKTLSRVREMDVLRFDGIENDLNAIDHYSFSSNLSTSPGGGERKDDNLIG